MKNYSTPEFELVVSLDSYCAGSIKADELSSIEAEDGWVHQIGLPYDPLEGFE